MTEENLFKTASLQLASSLKTHGVPYKNAYLGDDLNTVFFVFEKTPDVAELVVAYANNTPSAPPKTLFWNFRELSNEARRVRGGGAR